MVGEIGAEADAPTILSDEGLASGSLPEGVHVGTEPPLSGDFGKRYREIEAALGAGGMGQVHQVRDERIGRRVAIKRMHPHVAVALRARFLREARVQGQLEHPSVVPVYDLGVDPEGVPFFSMKRVRGRTLERVLHDLANGDEDSVAKFPRTRLLGAFCTLCLALDFAHTRGVVHRDVKPANIMLGDFGEVYLLDWGIARVGDDAEGDPIDVPGTTGTRAGALMGTPGYMAPEQIADGTSVDPRTDVYALGAVLFEILALEPLHQGANAEQLLRSTLKGVDARPSTRERVNDLAPELDAVCVRATALDPDDRLASARELHAAVQKYLDGDRDLELRRAMADEHLRRATELVERVARGDGDDPEQRAAAMRALGSALALAPASGPAVMTALGKLLSSFPTSLPSDAREALAQRRLVPLRALLRASVAAYALWLLFMLWTFTLGVREPLLLIAASAPIAAGASWMLHQSRMDDPHRGVVLQIVLCFTSVAASSVIFGPLVLTTLLAVSNGVGLLLAVEPRRRALVYVATLASFAVPSILEWLGVGATRYAFSNGAMHILPLAVDLPEMATRLVLFTSAIAITLATAYFVSRFRDEQLAAEERLQVHMWHLERVFPAS